MREVTEILTKEYPQIISLWEASVRSTHDFVKEVDILFFRTQIILYLGAVELCAIRDCQNSENNKIIGFMGTSNDEIEMLFVDPNYTGQGVGATLLQYATQICGKTKVSVNEQNGRALRFYEKCGFVVFGRSELDGTGKPYPILHLTNDWFE